MGMSITSDNWIDIHINWFIRYSSVIQRKYEWIVVNITKYYWIGVNTTKYYWMLLNMSEYNVIQRNILQYMWIGRLEPLSSFNF